jgi:hypothetical protein
VKHYAIISPRFWTGETGPQLVALGADEATIAFYLMTCPSANGIGIYHLPLVLMSKHLRMPENRVRKGLARVCDTGFASYDYDYQHVYVPAMAKHQIGERLAVSDLRVKGVHNSLRHFRESPFFNNFVARYLDDFHLQPFLPPSEGACDANNTISNKQSAISNEQSLKAPKGLEGEFDSWWKLYPRKVGKAEAAKVFPKVLAKIATERCDAFDWLCEVTRVFAESPAGNAGKYTPHPASWLNAGRYDDDQREWHRDGGLLIGAGQSHPEDQGSW